MGMAPRFLKGQRVKILSVRLANMTSKYPEIDKYVSETGIIIEDYFVRYMDPKNEKPPITSYMYSIKLDTTRRLITVAEDALEIYLG
ncbi:hypothetical protein [Dehalococcoides mccartyi]|jgi:ATP-dependent DNA ligase|uniref:Uncharacterized protein n=4 Tax=root TaxID=1 RepID=D2BHW9_DEHMV|nr:hypothetical protein [Dehalococcoides mccartyi]ACZ61919.1 hypothetical protein DhcVS_789 [Dehalococcoides mccartyi VS]